MTLSYLYVMVDGPICKIGVTCNPKRRSHELWYPSWKDGQPRIAPLKYVWQLPDDLTYVIEQRVCKHLEGYSISPHGGGEWFRISDRKMLAAVHKIATPFLGAGWSLATLRREFGSSGRKRGRRESIKPKSRK